MRPNGKLATFFLLIAGATGLAADPSSAQVLPWKEACIAIQPTIGCTADNRGAIEEAMASCRASADKPACHKQFLIQRRDRPIGPPTVIKGSRIN